MNDDVTFVPVDGVFDEIVEALLQMCTKLEDLAKTLREITVQPEPRVPKQRSTPRGGRLNAAIARPQKLRSMRQYTSATGM